MEKYIYIGFSETKQLWKIGFTKDVEKRAKRLGIRIEHVIPCQSETVRRWEALLLFSHRGFIDKHAEGEWYRLDADDLWIIKRIKNEVGLDNYAYSGGYAFVEKVGWINIESPSRYGFYWLEEEIRKGLRARRQSRRIAMKLFGFVPDRRRRRK